MASRARIEGHSIIPSIPSFGALRPASSQRNDERGSNARASCEF